MNDKLLSCGCPYVPDLPETIAGEFPVSCSLKERVCVCTNPIFELKSIPLFEAKRYLRRKHPFFGETEDGKPPKKFQGGQGAWGPPYERHLS